MIQSTTFEEIADVFTNGFCLWYDPFEFSKELEQVVKELFIEDHVVE